MKEIKKIAILTAGGDCPGLNPVIRAVTKTAITKYGLEVYGVRHGYFGLYHGDFIKLGLEWFYRLLCQPSRIGRMMALPRFLIGTYKEKFSTKK